MSHLHSQTGVLTAEGPVPGLPYTPQPGKRAFLTLPLRKQPPTQLSLNPTDPQVSLNGFKFLIYHLLFLVPVCPLLIALLGRFTCSWSKQIWKVFCSISSKNLSPFPRKLLGSFYSSTKSRPAYPQLLPSVANLWALPQQCRVFPHILQWRHC